jgi:hypothetical protein
MVGALPLLIGLAAASPAIAVPDGAPVGGLLELTTTGEVFLLAEHNSDRFRALLMTQAPERCTSLEAAMMDVEGYPKRWKQMEEVIATPDGPNRIRYSYELDMMFSPRLEGIVEHTKPGMIRYLDDDIPSDFTWMFQDRPAGTKARCHMVHRMVQPTGQRSDFVRLIEKLEGGCGDAAELAGALAAARGWAVPAQKRPAKLSLAGESAWEQLSGAGTAIQLINRPGNKRMLVRAGRRVAARPETVLKRIRLRPGYVKGFARGAGGVDFLDDVEVEGRETEWEVAYFGGNVTFRTAHREQGDVHQRSGLRITERVVDGDLKNGYWTWRVRQVPGGTQVDLEIDIDVTQGSMVLRTLAKQDPLIRRTNALQLALEYMRVVVAGKNLPASPARVAGAK